MLTLVKYHSKCEIQLLLFGGKKENSINVSTEGIAELNLWSWSTERHGDLSKAGVKGHFPLVLLASIVVGGQQVNLHGLDRLLHPLQNLAGGEKKKKNITRTVTELHVPPEATHASVDEADLER